MSNPNYLERAAALAPLIEGHAAQAEQEGALSEEVYRALIAAELFWMMVPAGIGGGGSDLIAAIDVIEEISRADGSTGWIFMANMMQTGVASAILGDEAIDAMFGAPDRAVVAGQLAPVGKARRAGNGYQAGGQYQFGSGSASATWIGSGVVVEPDGSHTQPEARMVFVPRAQVELRGNWDVMGLKATGSYDYIMPEQFVAADFTASVSGLVPRRGGAAFAIGLQPFAVAGHAGVALGLMKRALQEIATLAPGRTRRGYDGPISRCSRFQGDFARHEAAYWATRNYVIETFGVATAMAGKGFGVSDLMRGRMRQVGTWAHEVARDVIRFCQDWGGAEAIRSPSALGRCGRDIVVASQHLLVDSITYSESAPALLEAWGKG